MGKAERALREAIGGGVVIAFREAITGSSGTTNFPLSPALPATTPEKTSYNPKGSNKRGGKPPKVGKLSKLKKTKPADSTGTTEQGAQTPSTNFPLGKAPTIPMAKGSSSGASSGGGSG